MIFENRILRRIFEPKRERMGSEEDSRMRNFIVPLLILTAMISKFYL